MVYIKRQPRHHWFLCICPTVTSVSRRRRNQYCVYSQEETTCFTSASVTNRLPSRSFSCDLKRWKYRDSTDCGPWPTSTCVETSHKSDWQYKAQRNRAKWRRSSNPRLETNWLPQPLRYLHNAHQLSVTMVNEADKKHALMVRKGSWRDFSLLTALRYFSSFEAMTGVSTP